MPWSRVAPIGRCRASDIGGARHGAYHVRRDLTSTGHIVAIAESGQHVKCASSARSRAPTSASSPASAPARATPRAELLLQPASGYSVHQLLSGLRQLQRGRAVANTSRPRTGCRPITRCGTASPGSSRSELTPVSVPDGAHEAMPDLASAATAPAHARQGPPASAGFLLRHGRISRGVRGSTRPLKRSLTTIRFDHPAQQIVLQSLRPRVEDTSSGSSASSRRIKLLPSSSMAPSSRPCSDSSVGSDRCVTIVAEVGGLLSFRRSPPAHGLSGSYPRALERRACAAAASPPATPPARRS